MHDRNVEHPNRYQMVKVEGTDDVYDIVPAPGRVDNDGTLINKATLLKDSTAAKFGLGSDAVPDDVFRLLSRFHAGLGNEYVWEKLAGSSYKDFATHTTNSDYTIFSNTNNSKTFYYAESYTIGDNLKVSLVSPKSFVMTGDEAYKDSFYDVFRGKYLLSNHSAYENGDSLIFIPTNAALYTTGAGMSFYATFTPVESYSNPRLFEERERVGFVNSPDPNAYPVNDGFIYNPLGMLGEKANIASGSYVGTGTYSATYPSKLTFGFSPSLVIIVRDGYKPIPMGSLQAWDTRSFGVFVRGASHFAGYYARSSSYTAGMYYSITGNELSWYINSSYVSSYDDSPYQLNESGVSYHYIAIG